MVEADTPTLEVGLLTCQARTSCDVDIRLFSRINTRSETADEKRVFEQAWESRPCLVLSSGFYEWKSQNGGPKQPYRIYREDDPTFAMAGLWDVWE